jgi:ABC-type sulfate transport system permease subunit
MISGRFASAGEWLFRAICLLILVFLMLPTLLIVPMSFSTTAYLTFPPTGFSLEWYRAYLLDPEWIDATLFSLQIAALTTVASAVIGTMGSLALVRGQLPGRQTIEALLLAPLIVPPIIVAIAVYLQFAPLGLTGTRLGFVLIHTALAVPYVTLVVTAALQRLVRRDRGVVLHIGGRTQDRHAQAVRGYRVQPVAGDRRRVDDLRGGDDRSDVAGKRIQDGRLAGGALGHHPFKRSQPTDKDGRHRAPPCTRKGTVVPFTPY